jgi:hemolysin-activating ACP:hemolysin acyltransferase
MVAAQTPRSVRLKEKGPKTMKCGQFRNPYLALGIAMNLLRRVQPYASYPFGRFSNVLTGQIRRGHYVFTIADGVPIGYAGWALCEESVARAWVEGRAVPKASECLDGDCGLLITFCATSREACIRQIRHCRNLYPDKKIFAIREFGTHQRSVELFNRASAHPAVNDVSERAGRGSGKITRVQSKTGLSRKGGKNGAKKGASSVGTATKKTKAA